MSDHINSQTGELLKRNIKINKSESKNNTMLISGRKGKKVKEGLKGKLLDVVEFLKL